MYISLTVFSYYVSSGLSRFTCDVVFCNGYIFEVGYCIIETIISVFSADIRICLLTSCFHCCICLLFFVTQIICSICLYCREWRYFALP